MKPLHKLRATETTLHQQRLFMRHFQSCSSQNCFLSLLLKPSMSPQSKTHGLDLQLSPVWNCWVHARSIPVYTLVFRLSPLTAPQMCLTGPPGHVLGFSLGQLAEYQGGYGIRCDLFQGCRLGFHSPSYVL